MKKNRVTVFDFELTKIELPEIYFRISCTKGTYIRSIANDYGELLKVGAYLKELRRTKIGDYHVLKAQGVEKLVDDIQNIELKTD